MTLSEYLYELFKKHGRELEHTEEFKDLLKSYPKDLLRQLLRKALLERKVTIP